MWPVINVASLCLLPPCRAIVALVYNVLKAFMEMNSTLFDELTATYKSDRQRWETLLVHIFIVIAEGGFMNRCDGFWSLQSCSSLQPCYYHHASQTSGLIWAVVMKAAAGVQRGEESWKLISHWHSSVWDDRPLIRLQTCQGCWVGRKEYKTSQLIILTLEIIDSSLGSTCLFLQYFVYDQLREKANMLTQSCLRHSWLLFCCQWKKSVHF